MGEGEGNEEASTEDEDKDDKDPVLEHIKAGLGPALASDHHHNNNTRRMSKNKLTAPSLSSGPATPTCLSSSSQLPTPHQATLRSM